MNLSRVGWVALPVVVLASMACEKTNADSATTGSQSAPLVQAPPASGSSNTPAASASARSRPEHRQWRGGPVGMMMHAANDLDLKDAQRSALEKIEQQMHTDTEGTRADFKEFRTTLIAGVRAGKIDTAKLASFKANMEKAAQARKDKDADALNALYAALEPPQRKALVAAVKAKQTERQAHAEERKADAGKPADGEWQKKRTERLTSDLGLDDAQKKAVEALFTKGDHPTPEVMETMRSEMKKRTDDLLTAFEGEGFDAKKVDLSPSPAKKMGEATDKHVQTLSKLIAILKPEQREKLASSMEKPAGPRVGYPVDDESGYGNFFDDPVRGENGPGRRPERMLPPQ